MDPEKIVKELNDILELASLKVSWRLKNFLGGFIRNSKFFFQSFKVDDTNTASRLAAIESSAMQAASSRTGITSNDGANLQKSNQSGELFGGFCRWRHSP